MLDITLPVQSLQQLMEVSQYVGLSPSDYCSAALQIALDRDTRLISKDVERDALVC